jgi:AI-2E family transporter
VGYGLINAAIAALVEPRVFGQALGLSPLVVFLSMVCWGWLWGPVGAVLSVPLTVVVKIALAYVDGYEWLSRMLGPVVGAQGVGAPTIPPGLLTTTPSSRVTVGPASASVTASERAISSTGLPPVVLPVTASASSSGGLIQSSSTFSTGSLPRSDDEAGP